MRQLQLQEIGGAHVRRNHSRGYPVSMLTKIVSFERAGHYCLSLTFNDGSRGTHDFAPMVNEPGVLLAPLRDPDYFARAFLECGALTWHNGFDISPEWLRREMAGASELAPASVVA